MFLQQTSRANLLAVKSNAWLQTAFVFVGGVLFLSLLSQIVIPLPFTPVPLTGQTLGVALLALTLGKNRIVPIIITYLCIGAAGVPVFAHHSGFLTPTIGYLIGMLLASIVMGMLADRGWTNSFKKSLMATWIGSMIIFACGLTGLSFFVPTPHLLMAGFLPFLPGEAIKNVTAAFVVNRLHRKAS